MSAQKTLNLTQHTASADQLEVGVLDMSKYLGNAVKALLTFEEVPSAKEIQRRANKLAYLAKDVQRRLAKQDTAPYYCDEDEGMELPFRQVMIGGAPYLMGPLAATLRKYGLEPVFAFTERISVDEPQADGSVRKVAVFRHSGWVPAL